MNKLHNLIMNISLEVKAEIDTCWVENGECEHFCEEDEFQKKQNCSCADGYFLHVDGRSCIAKGWTVICKEQNVKNVL